MSMTPIPSTSALLALALLLAGAAAQPVAVHAQAAASAAPQKRLNWPRTFGGQPDFEFEREETLADRNKEAMQAGVVLPSVPALADLLEDTPLDPLRLTAVPSATVASATTLLPNVADPELGAGLLPSLTSPELSDLSEFRQSLLQALADYQAAWQPDLARYNLDYLTRQLKLQAVVTSPLSYAVINGQRYQAGDRFQLPVVMSPTDVDLLTVLDLQMPAPETLPPATMARYREVYDEVVQQLADVRQKNPAKYQSQVTVPVTVLAIQPRKVILNLNGQRQELAIKYAY